MRVLIKDRTSHESFHHMSPAAADPGEGPPRLFFYQTEARRAEKKLFGTRPPPLSQGLDDLPPPPPLSEGLDPTLASLSTLTSYSEETRGQQRDGNPVQDIVD